MTRPVTQRIALVAALTVVLVGKPAAFSAWTALTNQAPQFPGTMLLLSDGSVMVQGNPGHFMRLSPDATGNYVNGTWSTSTIANMSIGRQYYASHVLPNRKVWILGGEYTSPVDGSIYTSTETPTGEIYDVLTNTWSPIASYPPEPDCPDHAAACFGDDPTMLLPGGKILAGNLLNRTSRVYDLASNTWGAPVNKVYGDSSAEETWTLLPDFSVLTYDLFKSNATAGAYAERYDPGMNTWLPVSPSDGTALGTIPQLSSSDMDDEIGPALRLQDGRVFTIGATGHTALYDVATNTWTAGPDVRDGAGALFGALDAPAAVMPNGHVLFMADASPQFTTAFHPPTKVFDFNPVTNTISLALPSPSGNLATNLANPNSGFAFVTRMLVLPTGQVLVNDSSHQLWVYTPDGAAPLNLRPSVNSVTYAGADPGRPGRGTFLLTGKQLNGQNAGSNYGDDVESDENYPIVRLRSAAGLIYYCETYNWTNTGVATGGAPEAVYFTPPSGIPAGNYSLQVVGAGIGGLPIYVNITAAQIAGS